MHISRTKKASRGASLANVDMTSANLNGGPETSSFGLWLAISLNHCLKQIEARFLGQKISHIWGTIFEVGILDFPQIVIVLVPITHFRHFLCPLESESRATPTNERRVMRSVGR